MDESLRPSPGVLPNSETGDIPIRGGEDSGIVMPLFPEGWEGSPYWF